MKITDIKIHTLRPGKAFRYSDFPPLQFPINLLRVFTDTNIEGNFMSYQIRADTMAESINYLKPFLIGEDPFNREKIWQRVYKLGAFNVGAAIGPAFSAFDIALWDIAGKALKMPIYKLLGAFKDKIKAYASTPTYPSVNDYIDACKGLMEKGYTAIKLHVFGDPRKDIELARAVRQAVGEEVELLFDASMAYDREGALRVGRELDELSFGWYEDPLVNTDINGYVGLCRALDTPVAPGEGIGDWLIGPPINILYEYIRRGAADIIKAVGDWIGGITALRKIAALCEMAGIRFEPHNYGTTLVQAAHFHIELTSKNCQFFEIPVPEGLLDVGMKDTFRIDKEGYVPAPTKPGLGPEIDWKKVDKLTLKIL